MEEKGHISRERVLEIVRDLEFDAREELTEMEVKYDQMKLTLEALDETIIRLDGQLTMITQVRNRLRTIPIDPIPL